MGDGEKASLRLQFNPKVRLAFHGATITTDAGLLAFREFDDALGLTEIAEDYLQESRTGRNILHHLVPLLRQSIYSRLAGYDDTNDAVRLSQDPAMRVIVGWQGSERKGASTSEMGRFETEFLTQEDNRQALARMNTRWLERAMAHTLHQAGLAAGLLARGIVKEQAGPRARFHYQQDPCCVRRRRGPGHGIGRRGTVPCAFRGQPCHRGYMNTIYEVFLSRAEPASIGLSSIGGDLGVDQRFGDFRLGRTVVTI